jgi:RNA polymerase sigma-70 factor (ECF subfamily)
MEPDVRRIGHDPEAFAAFYREHVEAIQRFVTRRVADPHLAADLTADIFVAALESSAGYRRSRGVPAAWLFGIARHVVASELRRGSRERDANRRIEGRRLLQDDDIARMQERIDAAREARRLLDAMAALPDGERAVLELVALDGLSVADSARALGIRPVAARVRLHRARAALATDLPPTTPAPMEAA